MKNKKYVVLADIESIRIPFAAFNEALSELSKFGEVVSCKFYGYSSKRTKDYGEFIQDNNYDALSALPKKRKGKLDMRQVIDAVRLAQFPNVDGFFLIYGAGDITPLIAYLKAYNLDVIAGVIEPDKNSVLCNKVIILNSSPHTSL
ncbi:MAG TPA: NYN domain-containing protein [Clostridia bacterium]|nr:NYN domain-containing protein [Clostridia bacterium]